MSNRKAVETLGMPHGTAANRLRKILLFHQLKKHNENVCVRCGKEIEEVSQLSVEHIKPWEGRSAELFWDLNNIAFSHMKCNVQHSHNKNLDRRKVGPEGTAWCSTHQRFLPVSEFYKLETRWNGLSNKCKTCHDLSQGHGIKFGRHSKKHIGALAQSVERDTCNVEAVRA